MRSRWSRWRRVGARVDEGTPPPSPAPPPFDVAEDDPLLLHLQQHPQTVAVTARRDQRQQVIAAALPHIDGCVAGHSFAAFEELIEVVARA